MKKSLLFMLAFLFYSEKGHVSGRNEEVDLDELVMQSTLIVIAKPSGTSNPQKTKDGLHSFSVQKYEITKTIYPKTFEKKEISVSTYSGHHHDIAQMYAKGIKKIGLFSYYPSPKLEEERRILFLREGPPVSESDYIFALQGSFETVTREDEVLKLVDKLKSGSVAAPILRK